MRVLEGWLRAALLGAAVVAGLLLGLLRVATERR